nr:kunitz-type serine protease inhibitor C3 [Drosophila suzukii]
MLLKISLKKYCFGKTHLKFYLRSWFYNSTAQRCQKFIFLGGARNGNNFNSQARCRKICLAQVPLPINFSFTDDGV